MKFLDYLFHGKELKAIGNYFKMLNGYSPTFTSFSGGVYEMDLTRTAINNFATHCSKLKPEIEGSALKSLEKTLQHKPNYFMDTTKFIKRLATYVAVEHTAFIIPIEDEYGRLCGWYPLRAERCEVVESEGQLYLRYLFANGSYGAIEFERVGIMTDFEYKDDLFGEDNSTLAPTMQLIHTQNEGIINAVKNSANIRFLAKVANMLKPEDIKKERKRFTEDNLSADNDSGMIIYDNKFSELKQVESKPYTPNALQMQHIQENVCTHFGTNMDILQNKFDENTWNAYYEGKIEPFAIQLSLVMTNMSFTERERACGNAIFFSANRLQYASNATKLNSLPFNAVAVDGEYDRVYKAEDWAWYFATFIANGIFPKPSDGLQVVAYSGMEIRVNAGYAFINGYAFRNPATLSVTLDTAEGALNRVECLYVRWRSWGV